MNSDEQASNIYFDTNIHAGSEGETVQLLSDKLLTGKTCQCVIVSPNGLRTTPSVTVSSDGTYGYLTTTPSTFPFPGTYELMLQIVNNDGSFTNSDPITLTVIASI